jgi:predicted nucleic acid-binding protein
MQIYFDTSALIKRVVIEPESSSLIDALDGHAKANDVLVSSSLAWVEVTRALRARTRLSHAEAAAAADDAMSGLAEQPISTEVVNLARRIDPRVLRSLDAVHLASAVLLGADVVVTYDERLAIACESNGLATAAPRN